MLVSGPIATNVTGCGACISASRIAWKAGFAIAWRSCSTNSYPSIPDSPCTEAASRSGRTSGIDAPCASGISAFQKCSNCNALRVVFSTETLPATVVISCRSSSGANSAAAIAAASSMPGSVSRMIGKRMVSP